MEGTNLSLLGVGGMMHMVIRLFKKKTESEKGPDVRLSVEQFSLLYALSLKEEEVIQKDMAELMGKHKSAILRSIDTLEEKELVRRVVDPKDRRKNYLMVTKLGNKVIEYYNKLVDEIMQELQQGLVQREIDDFHKVVHHVKVKAEKLLVD